MRNKKISSLKPYPDNPRIHGDGKGLSKSILDLGDLSGVVYNVRLRKLVGGHYRTKVIPEESIIEKVPITDPTGTVAEGTIILPGGQRLNYREVDWDETKHKLGCVEANNQEIQGDWNEELLEPLLADLNEDLSEGDFDDFGLDLLAEEFKIEFEFKNDPEKISEKPEKVANVGIPLFIMLSDADYEKWSDMKLDRNCDSDTHLLLELINEL